MFSTLAVLLYRQSKSPFLMCEPSKIFTKSVPWKKNSVYSSHLLQKLVVVVDMYIPSTVSLPSLLAHVVSPTFSHIVAEFLAQNIRNIKQGFMYHCHCSIAANACAIGSLYMSTLSLCITYCSIPKIAEPNRVGRGSTVFLEALKHGVGGQQYMSFILDGPIDSWRGFGIVIYQALSELAVGNLLSRPGFLLMTRKAFLFDLVQCNCFLASCLVLESRYLQFSPCSLSYPSFLDFAKPYRTKKTIS